MKYFALILLQYLTYIALAQSPVHKPISNEQQEIVFLDVNVVPMDQESVLEHQTVVVKNGAIAEVGPVNKIKYSKSALVIDGKGKYLIPGLAEMHAHVPPVENLDAMKEVLLLFASNGVTTIRGMLGHPKHLELRTKIQNGEILGPRFFTTGPSFNGFSVESPEGAVDMVRKQKEEGYDYLKLHPGLRRIEFDSIAATAKRLNIPFVGHVSYGVGVWRAAEAGYSSIDHLDGFVEALVPGIDTIPENKTGLFALNIGHHADTSKIPQLMNALKSNNVWVVPTQSLAERWMNPDFEASSFRNDPDAVYITTTMLDDWNKAKKSITESSDYKPENHRKVILLRRKLINECQKNGVGLLLGSDAPQVYNVPGFSTHNELEYLVEAGLTPFQALQTGTVNVGKYLNNENIGIIRKGAAADLLLLEGNPLTDIAETKNFLGVMMGKQWLSKEYLEEELKILRKQ